MLLMGMVVLLPNSNSLSKFQFGSLYTLWRAIFEIDLFRFAVLWKHLINFKEKAAAVDWGLPYYICKYSWMECWNRIYSDCGKYYLHFLPSMKYKMLGLCWTITILCVLQRHCSLLQNFFYWRNERPHPFYLSTLMISRTNGTVTRKV